MRASAWVLVAAALLAAGCSKEVEEAEQGQQKDAKSELPKDNYVFALVTNACRLIAKLENPTDAPGAIDTKELDVRGLDADGFRRELTQFMPGGEVHVWMPGRQRWLLVGRATTNRVSLAAAMDALAFDDGCASLPELFASYVGMREDVLPAFTGKLQGEVVPEWFMTKEIPKIDWMDVSGVDDDILRPTLAEIRSMQVVRRVALEGDMLAAAAKDKEGEEKAAAAWARALLRNPHELFVLERLDRLARNARGFLEVGKALQALKCYETMVLVKPDSRNVRHFGLCLRKIGRVDFAKKVLERAEQLRRAEESAP